MTLDKSLLEKVRETAYKYALLNAVKHEGKPSLKAVVAKVVGEIPEIRKHIREIIDVIREVVNEVSKLTLEEQIKTIKKEWPELLSEERKEEKKELPPLPGALLGKVVTRFAPNPDYVIHLGNARPALLSYWYAEKYKGKMILRFEDTDPRTKASFPEAYERIKEDLRWLGIKWDEEYIQSMRLPIFYDILYKLIEKGGAYVDKCKASEFKKYRDSGKPCPHRDLPIETQLEELDKILEGHYGEGEAVIRVKTDLSHPDPSVRDWVAARIIDTTKTPHPIVGEKYILWPTYNLAAAVDDHIMGITHILRAKEHVSNTFKQSYLYDHMGWKYPETIHFGRLSLEGVVLSKSKMRALVREQGMEAYDDPRFGTISGLRRRGIVKEALWEIIKDVGTKAIDAHISYVNLASINRSIIDPIATRYMGVEKPVYAILKGFSTNIKARIPRLLNKNDYHEYIIKPKSIVAFSVNDLKLFINKKIVRLIGLGNFVLENIEITEDQIIAVLNLHSLSHEDAKKLRAPIIQWVLPAESTNLELVIPEAMKIRRSYMLVEKDIIDREKPGNHIQLYRVGFARIDSINEDKIVAIFSHT